MLSIILLRETYYNFYLIVLLIQYNGEYEKIFYNHKIFYDIHSIYGRKLIIYEEQVQAVNTKNLETSVHCLKCHELNLLIADSLKNTNRRIFSKNKITKKK